MESFPSEGQWSFGKTLSSSSGPASGSPTSRTSPRSRAAQNMGHAATADTFESWMHQAGEAMFGTETIAAASNIAASLKRLGSRRSVGAADEDEDFSGVSAQPSLRRGMSAMESFTDSLKKLAKKDSHSSKEGMSIEELLGHGPQQVDQLRRNFAKQKKKTLVATGGDTGKLKMWGLRTECDPIEVTLEAVLGHIPGDNSSFYSLDSKWCGHRAAITSMSFPPGGRALTSSKDCTARMWSLHGHLLGQYPRSHREADLEEERLRRKMPYLRELQAKYRDSPDLPEVFSTPEQAPREQPHEKSVNMASVDSMSDYVLTCSDDNTAVIWDATTGCRWRTLGGEDCDGGHHGPVPMAVWRHDGERVMTCSYDHTCILWNPTTGEPELRFAGMVHAKHGDDVRLGKHTGPIWSVCFSKDGDAALTACKDSRVKVWDLANGGKCLSTFAAHTRGVVRAIWDEHNPSLVLSCSLDYTARLHDTRSSTEVAAFQHRACVWSASFGQEPLGDGKLVITASHDMTAALYDTRKAEAPVQTLLGHEGILWQAALSVNDTIVLTNSDDGTARVWDLSGGGPQPGSTILAEAGYGRTHDMGVSCAMFVPHN